jgi:hypothetical protein
MALPGATARARVLSASGHGYWLRGVQVAMALAAAGLAVLAVRRLRAGGAEPARFGFLRLAVSQVAMFVMLEVVERLIAGEPVAQMFAHHLFMVGVLVQILVAAAGIRLVRWFERTVDRIAGLFERPVLGRSRGRVLLPAMVSVRSVELLAGAAGLRSPPSR